MNQYKALFQIIGRVLLSLIFLVSGVSKILGWHQTVAWVASKGVPAAPVLLAVAVGVELLGGLSVLTGFCSKLGALLLIAYLIPVTVMFHNFWSFQGAERQLQWIMFLKNVAIVGGLFLVEALGDPREKDSY
jgi:putative oxidoreductase